MNMKKNLLVVSLFASCLAFAEPLLKNPGFEDVDEKGNLTGWGGKAPVYTRDTTTFRSGKASLHFQNMNKENYVLCGQKIKLDKNKSYEFGVWVKSSGMKGAGPTVCIEFWKTDDDGKQQYIGGSYPGGAQDTNGEWKLVKDIVKAIPEAAESINITVYCRQASTGDAWFDDVYLREYNPPMLSVMTTDKYRHITDGEDFAVFASVTCPNKNILPVNIPGINLKVTDAAGKVFASYKPVSGDKSSVKFDVKAKALKPGQYTLLLSAVNPKTNKEESASLKFTKVDKYPQRYSYIDKYNRLIVDGKPFFPFGLYFANTPKKEVDIYKDSAFNCVMPYHRISRDDLDYLNANNIKVIYSVKDYYPGRLGLKTQEDADAKTSSVINDLKDHPAIIAWYVNDEMPLNMLPSLTAKRDLVEKLDPGRPAWVVLYQYNDIRDYLPSYDVIGTDPYPIPGKSPEVALDWARKTTNGTFNCKANWMVPQIFNWASYWGQYGKKEAEILACRAPTFEEMKAMSWMCVAGGANGLIYYSWFDLLRMGKLVKDGGRALRVDPFEERWAEVKKMAADFGRLMDVLLSVDPVIEMKPVKADNSIGVRSYGKGKETWLLLVNSSEKKAADVAFEAPFDIACVGQDLGESKPAVDGKKLSVNLKPLESLFVRIVKK